MNARESEKVDRVLVEAEQKQDGTIRVVPGTDVHPHPGVPVADLLEELELRDALWDRKYTTDRSERLKAEARVEELRAAREAAKKPKLKKGWIKVTQRDLFVRGDGKVAVNIAAWDGRIRRDVEDTLIFIHPDDIRTEKP